MSLDEPEKLYGPAMAATTALASLVGVAVGVLREKGLLAQAEVTALFKLADELLPPEATPFGTTIITAAKLTADRVQLELDNRTDDK